MKRKTKTILIGLVAIIYVVIALNFNKIKYTFNMLSIYNEDRKAGDSNDVSRGDLDEEKDLENPLEAILNENIDKDEFNEEIENDQVENPNEEHEDSIDKPSENSKKTDENKSQGQEDSSTKKNSDKSYTSIINSYNSRLGSLQSEFEGDLNSLVSQGFDDYSSGNLSKTQLASKYLSQGASLEKSSDAQFKSLLKDMEKELKANNHDTSVVKEIDSYYKSYKNSKKSSIISKGMSYIN